jgi:hypothetical protein
LIFTEYHPLQGPALSGIAELEMTDENALGRQSSTPGLGRAHVMHVPPATLFPQTEGEGVLLENSMNPFLVEQPSGHECTPDDRQFATLL